MSDNRSRIKYEFYAGQSDIEDKLISVRNDRKVIRDYILIGWLIDRWLGNSVAFSKSFDIDIESVKTGSQARSGTLNIPSTLVEDDYVFRNLWLGIKELCISSNKNDSIKLKQKIRRWALLGGILSHLTNETEDRLSLRPYEGSPLGLDMNQLSQFFSTFQAPVTKSEPLVVTEASEEPAPMKDAETHTVAKASSNKITNLDMF